MFDVDNLIANAGADYVVPEILPGIDCKECGGALKFMLAMTPPECQTARNVDPRSASKIDPSIA